MLFLHEMKYPQAESWSISVSPSPKRFCPPIAGSVLTGAPLWPDLSADSDPHFGCCACIICAMPPDTAVAEFQMPLQMLRLLCREGKWTIRGLFPMLCGH